MNRRSDHLRRVASPPPRRGSVLVVVLALLAALMLLGFVFYTVAAQERENARYFTASEKWYAAQLAPDELFDFALEQIIVGPQDDYVNSALWGGRYSLLASLVGDDAQPYSGEGVNVIDASQLLTPGTPGRPVVDRDRDGIEDTTHDLSGDGIDDSLALNVAQLAVDLGGAQTDFRSHLPRPDVGYSYPDLNSPFLAYIGTEPTTGNRVVIPSFHRPQYLRGLMPPGSSATWYTDLATRPYVLRPHAERTVLQFDFSTGLIADTGTYRFTDAALTSPPAFKEGYWSWNGDPASAAAPDFNTFDVDADGDATNGKEAVLLDLDHPVEETPDGVTKFVPLFGVTIYDLDGLLNLNAHGNLYGQAENVAAFPDTPFEFLSKSNEGRRRYEVNPQYALDANDGVGEAHTGFITGPMTPTKLANIEWWFILAGRADYDTTSGAVKEPPYPGRWGEATRLLDALKAGSTSAYDFPRPGDSLSDEVEGATADATRGMAFDDRSRRLFPLGIYFPRPGHPEDNQGQGTFVNTDGKTPLLTPITGPGRIQTLAYLNYWLPQSTDLTDPSINPNPAPLWALAQAVFGFNPQIVTNAATGVRTVAGVYGGAAGYLVDDPGETLLDPEQARDQVNDSIFGVDETASLHLPDNTRDANGIVSRLLDLVPANFDESTDADQRRKRFTTVSSDLKSYSVSADRMRPYETRQDLWSSMTPGQLALAGVFPPHFGATPIVDNPATTPYRDPFRAEARAILQQSVPLQQGNRVVRDEVKGLVRKLSVNHVSAAYASYGSDGKPRYLLRPVTPHPGTLPSGQPLLGSFQVTGPPGVNQFGTPDVRLIELENQTNGPNGYFPATIPQIDHDGDGATPLVPDPALQEWHARRDRQNLARDIYVLLYTLALPDATATNPVTGTTPPYTDAQMAEMAQFAVNVVDAMDPDDTITAFVYDKNLALDGYTALDNGYAGTLGFDPATWNPTTGRYEDAERGVVYGVESQKLVIGEALAMFAHHYKETSTSPEADHMATEWDDSAHRDFAYVELQNMSPSTVRMNGGWSIVCQPDFVPSTVGTPMSRSLTIVNGVDVPAGGAYTVGSAGDAQNVDPDSGLLRPSFVMVDPAATSSSAPTTPPAYQQIAPAAGALAFDAILANPTDYRVNEFAAAATLPAATSNRPPVSEDGAAITDDVDDPAPTPPSPPAGQWFYLGPQGDRAAAKANPGDVRFRLRRRLNLNREFPPQAGDGSDADQQRDNPWIEVDVNTSPLRVFDLSGSTDAAAVQTVLREEIASSLRPEPLDRDKYVDSAFDADPTTVDYAVDDYRRNSLGGYTPQQTEAGNLPKLWHRHFDRWFGSLADVLNVPLYGPHEVTDAVTVNGGPATGDKTSIAAARFLFPDQEPRLVIPPPVSGTPVWPLAAPGTAGNLWYRLLEFIEVPQKYGDNDGLPWFAHLGGPAPWGPQQADELHVREFGRLNLNTMRHHQVLAGLLDDPRVIDPSAGGYLRSRGDTPNETYLGTSLARDWWLAMVASRDGGFDPFTKTHTGADVILPGVPSAKPFLPFGAAAFTTAATPVDRQWESFRRSILRPMPGATPPNLSGYETGQGRRSLFELGNEIPGAAAGQLGGFVPRFAGDTDMNQGEFATRYRLLGKVLNHGTTRSNTFLAFLTCDFYEANGVDHDSDVSTPEVFQIGTRLPVDGEDPANPEPRYRGVFTIDRTLALQLLERQGLPPRDPALRYPPENPSRQQYNKYSTYSFAREAGPDGRPQPVFDWRKLVLHRKVTKSR